MAIITLVEQLEINCKNFGNRESVAQKIHSVRCLYLLTSELIYKSSSTALYTVEPNVTKVLFESFAVFAEAFNSADRYRTLRSYRNQQLFTNTPPLLYIYDEVLGSITKIS